MALKAYTMALEGRLVFVARDRFRTLAQAQNLNLWKMNPE
jgi:hypothetical protein